MPSPDPAGKPIWRHWRCFVIGIAALLTAGVPGRAQSSPPPAVIPMDSSSVGRVSYSRMQTTLEKTLLKVDVASLDVWLGDEGAAGLEGIVSGEPYSKELADSLADIAMRSRDVFIRVEFLRNVDLDQFLDGADDNLKRTLKAGVITEAEYEMISAGMPVWYSFLEERGIRDGDVMRYRIRGDTLRTQFLSLEGKLLMDQTDVGPERRRSVLGSYFVREGLIKSLFGEGG